MQPHKILGACVRACACACVQAGHTQTNMQLQAWLFPLSFSSAEVSPWQSQIRVRHKQRRCPHTLSLVSPTVPWGKLLSSAPARTLAVTQPARPTPTGCRVRLQLPVCASPGQASPVCVIYARGQEAKQPAPQGSLLLPFDNHTHVHMHAYTRRNPQVHAYVISPGFLGNKVAYTPTWHTTTCESSHWAKAWDHVYTVDSQKQLLKILIVELS